MRSADRDGNVSLVLPGDDGGTHAELGGSRYLVGALNGPPGRHPALPQVSCHVAAFTRLRFAREILGRPFHGSRFQFHGSSFDVIRADFTRPRQCTSTGSEPSP